LICLSRRAGHLDSQPYQHSRRFDIVHRFAFSQGSAKYPSPRRRRRRAAIALALLVLAVRVVFLVWITVGNKTFHALPYPWCGTAAFEPPESREGLCAIDEHSNIVVKNIVDRNSTLHMPEYDARLITWTVGRARVTNWRTVEPGRYPEGQGALVSLEVEISNPGDEPLQYGPLITRSSVPSYSSRPPAELALPIPAGPGEGESFAALFNPRGAPIPSLFGQPPIQPGSRITGWISVITPPNAGAMVGLERSGLELWPVDGNPSYVGIIRLWKRAGTGLVRSAAA